VKLRLALRMAWRDWRSGELGLLLVALLVAIGTVTAISLFVDRLHQALLLESANLLAADRYIGGSRPIPDEFRRVAERRGLDAADVLSFPSMVFAGEERNQLVAVKAVSEGYPLRGTLIAGTQPFARGAPVADIPLPGEVWIDSRLFPALDVRLGERVEVGMASLRVARVLVKEPDAGGSFFNLGPRLLMNLADVPATEVVQPGSRISYRLLLRGPDAALEALREELAVEPDFRWAGIRESSPRIGAALDRALALAERVGKQSPSAVSACKGLIQQARSGHIAGAYTTERDAFVGLFDTADQKEGVNAFLEKRQPQWING